MIQRRSIPITHFVVLFAKLSFDQSRPLASTPTQTVVATITRYSQIKARPSLRVPQLNGR
jgi:hypothetical protein